MVFNIINSSDVRPGDHIYRYHWFQIQHGIAVRYPKLSPIFVITSFKNTLKLVTLNEFKGRSWLRRMTYKENNSCIKKTTCSHSRPPEEIVQNAFLLLEWIKTSPDRVQTLLDNDLSQFAQKCCTTVHDQWRNLFPLTQEQASSPKHFFGKEKISCRRNAFNTALLCGMSFRQASQIGSDEFWSDKHDESRSSQTTNDSVDQALSSRESTSNETMIFSPTLTELSSDDNLCLIQISEP